MNTKKLMTLALLTATALIIFVVEAYLPPPAPIPGMKIGLANIITLVALALYGRREAFLILLVRVVLGNLLVGQFFAMLYSLAGGLACYLVMCVCYRLLGQERLWVISVFGALAHNVGQIAVAVAVTGTWQIVWYLPLLAAFGMIAGAFTGLAATFVLRRLQRLSQKRREDK